VTSKSGTGSIDSFSLMDYSSGPQVIEIPCSKKNVEIVTGTTTLSIPFSKPVVAVMGLPGKHSLKERILTHDESIYVPFDGKSTITITNIQGRTLSSFQTDKHGWFSLRDMVSKGKYLVSVKNRTVKTITAMVDLEINNSVR
jgi:hypothetical protein